MVYLQTAIGFIIKMFTFKKGSLFLVSGFLATGFSYYIDLLLKDVDLRDGLVTIVVELVFLTIFMLFTTTDLITGIQTAFYVNAMSPYPIPKDKVVKSSKLWRTFWKGFGVIILTGMLTFFAIITTLLKSDVAYWIAIWSLICFWIMACGFEFYSIGENLAKRNNGNKPPIFGFVDKVLDAVQRKAISKIDSSFNMLDDATKTYDKGDISQDAEEETINK